MGRAKKDPDGREESSRSLAVIETIPVGTGGVFGATVADAPAATQPRSTQMASPSAVVNRVSTA